MRSDARALLEKLGRQNFSYHQFHDRFADLELWPVFEALLKDPRFVEVEKSRFERLKSETVPLGSDDAGRAPAISPSEQPSVGQQHAPFLGAFGPSETEAIASVQSVPPLAGSHDQAPQAEKQDLRTFLSQLESRAK